MTEVKLSINPYSPSIEAVENFVMMIHVPYSNKEVTIKIDSSIQEYIENDDKPGIKIRKMTIMQDTKYTRTLRFDFKENNTHSIEIDNRKFDIRLIEIGDEEIEEVQGQSFKFFRFTIQEK